MSEMLEPLRPAEVLARTDLVVAGGRGSDRAGERLSEFACGRPLIYPVVPAELPAALRRRATATGVRYFGALFALDLAQLPGGQHYVAAHLRIRLSDPGVVAVDVHADGDELGLVLDGTVVRPSSAPAVAALAAAGPVRPGWPVRLLPRRGEVRAAVHGVQRSEFGWSYDDPSGGIGPTMAVHALLEAPTGSTALAGVVRLDAEVVRGVLGVPTRYAVTGQVGFAEPLPVVDPAAPAASVRLCMAADIKGYSRHRNPLQERLQRDLLEVLRAARGRAGIDEEAVDRQQAGDGQFAVLPPGLDESAVIPELVSALGAGLAEANRGLAGQTRMRLRVALHRGLMKPGDNGWVGDAAIGVHRILDSPPARQLLESDEKTDFVLVVPDVLYRDVIAHGYGDLHPEGFTEAVVDLPDKRFVEHVWLLAGSTGSAA